MHYYCCEFCIAVSPYSLHNTAIAEPYYDCEQFYVIDLLCRCAQMPAGGGWWRAGADGVVQQWLPAAIRRLRPRWPKHRGNAWGRLHEGHQAARAARVEQLRGQFYITLAHGFISYTLH